MKSHGSMNRVYRLIWSQVLNGWVAVAESGRGRGKGASRKLIAAALSLSAAFAQAAPVGGEVVSGAGSIAQSGTTTTIQQASQNLSLNWQSFNIAPQETVNFVQPSASAIAVNRIFDTSGTKILGQLNANGQVVLINPNGILFGQGSQVNVGGLVASTLDLNDASLNGTTRTFSGNGTGSVVNQGTINATGSGGTGGYVALLGNTVSNQGTITAPQGTVALGAGNAATLTFQNNSLVKMQIDQSVLNSLAENGGLIRADGGIVVMSAGAKDALLASVVNNTGVIEARTVENHEGSITLLGGMTAGTTYVGGTLNASAPNGGNGGFIETSAAHVKIANDAKITTAAATGLTGTWLIDPVDFTIAASSGDITGAALGTLLASNSITIQTATGTNTPTNLYGSTGANGDIHVNDAVSWSANNTLTLDAFRHININQSITATTGKLALLYGQGSTDGVIDSVTSAYNVNAPVNLSAGPNFSTKLGSDGAVKNFTVITSLGAAADATGGAATLQGMAATANLATNYVLGSNIEACATGGCGTPANAWNAGAGFTPIGYSTTPFTGTFDGLGHTISNLTINRETENYVGLFGFSAGSFIPDVGMVGSSIRNVGLVGGSVRGVNFVGGLVGYMDYGMVSSSYATGDVRGNQNVGGLVGTHTSPTTITNSYATGNVEGISNVGGLVGYNIGTVSNSYATGHVTGVGEENVGIGGLVGSNSGSISNSYATGSVDGGGGNSRSAGGLVGYNDGTVYNSYAKVGDVFGASEVGGLVGTSYGEVTYSYATGNVEGISSIGGLVGYSDNDGGVVDNSYATGSVSGTYSVGGLVGDNSGGSIINSYATGSVSGDDKVGGLVGGGYGPVDKSYATGLVIGTSNFGGLLGFHDFSGGYGSVNSSFWDSDINLIGIGSSTPGDTTGATGRTTAEMMSMATFSNAGWDIVNTGGSGAVWRIYEGSTTPWLTWWLKPVTVTLNSDIQTYSGAPYSGGNGYAVGNPAPSLSGTVGSPNPALLGTLAYGGDSQSAVNAGSYTIGASGLYSVQQGYDISFVDGNLTISKAPAIVTANSDTKTYTGVSQSVSGFTASGLVNSETTSVLSGVTAGASGTNAGSYTATAGVGSYSGNYTLSFVDGNLTINKAHLTVTADNKTRLYGAANLALSTTVSGFVNGETAGTAAGFTGAGSATTTAGATTPVGTAVITAGAGNLAATNYAFTNLVDGTLTINSAALTLHPATPPAPVLNAMAQLQSEALFYRMNIEPQTLNLSPTLTVTQSSGTGSAASSSESVNPAAGSTRMNVNTLMNVNTIVMGPSLQIMNIGATGTTLQIVNGGMRLPDTLANEN